MGSVSVKAFKNHRLGKQTGSKQRPVLTVGGEAGRPIRPRGQLKGACADQPPACLPPSRPGASSHCPSSSTVGCGSPALPPTPHCVLSPWLSACSHTVGLGGTPCGHLRHCPALSQHPHTEASYSPQKPAGSTGIPKGSGSPSCLQPESLMLLHALRPSEQGFSPSQLETDGVASQRGNFYPRL